MITARSPIAGVIGAPISHSMSPLLMNCWATAAGIDAVYIALSAHPEFSACDFQSLARTGLVGVNVTLPFKKTAALAANILSESARLAGAANLLKFETNEIHADNTDIAGIAYALAQAGADFENRSVLVLGAGGAGQAACVAAILGQAKTIVVSNRTRSRADEIKKRFTQISTCSWEERNRIAAKSDLVINATSLGLDGLSDPGIDWSCCSAETIVFDMIYSPLNRPFETGARDAGLCFVSGLSMLIGQAIPSFEAFFGQPHPAGVDAESLLEKALQDAPV